MNRLVKYHILILSRKKTVFTMENFEQINGTAVHENLVEKTDWFSFLSEMGHLSEVAV